MNRDGHPITCLPFLKGNIEATFSVNTIDFQQAISNKEVNQ